MRRELVLSDRLHERRHPHQLLPGRRSSTGSSSRSAPTSPTSSRCAAGGATAAASTSRPSRGRPSSTFGYRGPRRTARCGRGPVRRPAGPAHPSAARGGASARSRAARSQLEWEVVRRRGRATGGAACPPLADWTSAADTPRQRIPRAGARECSRWATDVAEFDVTLRRAADDLRALYVAVDGDDGDLRRHPVVLHGVRAGLRDHVAADAAAQPAHRDGHAALPRPAPGHARGSVHRGAAGKDPARAPPGRDGAERRDPARALLRQRRRDAALAGAAPRDLALDRRHWRWCASCCPTRSARSSGSTATATSTATGSSSTPGPRRRGW